MRRALPIFVAAALALCAVPAQARPPIATGAYIPGASEDPALIDRFGREAGRAPVIVSSYKDWSSLPFDSTELDAIWRRGGVPMITWEPWTGDQRPFPLREIAAGRDDRYLRRAAGSAANWGRPLMVRFAQEMNGDWFPWGRGVDGNTARDFRKAWKHVVDLFRFHGATNVIWVWSPNEDSGGNHQFAPLYPGDPWVDWVALDGFNFGGSQGWPSFTTIFGSTYDRLVDLTSRPLMIAETASGDEGGDKAEWITSALLGEAPRFPHIRALAWFDDRHGDADFRIDSSAGSLRAYRQAVTAPAYAGSRETLLRTPPRLAGKAPAPPAPDGGYGAPGFFQRAWTELGDHLAVVLAAALVLVLLVLIAGAVAVRRGRRRAAVSP